MAKSIADVNKVTANIIEQLTQLEKRVTSQQKVQPSAAHDDEISKLRLDYDAKFNSMREDYELKIANLESKMSLIIDTKCDATLNAIKLFISHLDEKIDKMIVRVADAEKALPIQ